MEPPDYQTHWPVAQVPKQVQTTFASENRRRRPPRWIALGSRESPAEKAFRPPVFDSERSREFSVYRCRSQSSHGSSSFTAQLNFPLNNKHSRSGGLPHHQPTFIAQPILQQESNTTIYNRGGNPMYSVWAGLKRIYSGAEIDNAPQRPLQSDVPMQKRMSVHPK